MAKYFESNFVLTEAWRGGLSINNHAISLCAQGHVFEGKKLLREALDLIKICCVPTPEEPAEAEDISSRIQRSFHLITSLSKKMGVVGPSILNRVQVLHNTGCHVATPIPSPTPDLQHQLFSFIQLEASPNPFCGMGTRQRDLELHSALILYNFGIAHLFEDLFTPGYVNRKTLSSSLKLFQASHMLLSRGIQHFSLGAIPDHVAYTNLLTLEKIHALLHVLGFSKDAEQVALKVQEMRDYLDFWRNLFASKHGLAPAA